MTKINETSVQREPIKATLEFIVSNVQAVCTLIILKFAHFRASVCNLFWNSGQDESPGSMWKQ